MDTKKTTKSRVEAAMYIDLAGRRTYGEYLKLDRLFAAQQPVSQEHDEVAFIIIHHVQELWLKLVAHEIEAAMTSIRADNLPPAFKSLARVTRIQEQLITAWDVLSTMTPADYLAFRSALGPASGLFRPARFGSGLGSSSACVRSVAKANRTSASVALRSASSTVSDRTARSRSSFVSARTSATTPARTSRLNRRSSAMATSIND